MKAAGIIASMLLVGVCCGQSLELSDELGGLLSEEFSETSSENQPPVEYLSGDFEVINLNRATADELKLIPWLTPLQIQTLKNYLVKNGPLVSIYELQAVPGWDLATIRLTEPLIRIDDNSQHHDPRKFTDRIRYDGGPEFMFRVKRRLELSSGFNTPGGARFLGSPNYWWYRFNYHNKGSWYFGITAEKDPGELFHFKPGINQLGPDYLSAYLQLENKGILKRLVIGSFRAQWDQGLILANGFGLGQQVITGPRKVHRGFTRHTSAQEYGFLSGIGVEIGDYKKTISSFYSRRKLDAQINQEDARLNLPVHITSILETGLHRTNVELERRRKVTQHLAGIHLQNKLFEELSISVSALYMRLQSALIPNLTRYNKKWFRGRENFNFSGSIEYLLNNLNFYTQIAVSTSTGWAGQMGVIANLSHNTEISVHIRNLTPNFHSIAGHAFAVKSGNRNEQGLYWGIQVSPNRKVVTGLLVNFYRFPGPSFSADGPSHGMNHLLRLQYFPGKNQFLNIYWKGKNRLENATPIIGKSTQDLVAVSKHILGIRAKWMDESNLTIFSTIQYSNHKKQDIVSEGVIVSNRVSYQLKSLNITASATLFNTDNFENRQYIYESNFPYSLSIPFFQGTGFRWYGMVRIKINRNLDFWARIAKTRFKNITELGNGPDTIAGNKRTDLSLQISYKL